MWKYCMSPSQTQSTKLIMVFWDLIYVLYMKKKDAKIVNTTVKLGAAFQHL